MDERELGRAEQEQELLAWERAELEAELLREARLDEERAIVEAGGSVEVEELDTEDVPF